ncbi:MAG: dockerin type I repeat-containing protein [Spirochaetales bacterium]|nr:dockerin type I repeat-containing protein [Spirochaetales bacterium]
MGDVNNDGSIDIVDALLVARFYVELNPTPVYPEAMDVNCDSFADIIDAFLIAQYYIGLVSSFC